VNWYWGGIMGWEWEWESGLKGLGRGVVFFSFLSSVIHWGARKGGLIGTVISLFGFFLDHKYIGWRLALGRLAELAYLSWYGFSGTGREVRSIFLVILGN
jgi:hypothetical protein